MTNNHAQDIDFNKAKGLGTEWEQKMFDDVLNEEVFYISNKPGAEAYRKLSENRAMSVKNREMIGWQDVKRMVYTKS